MRFVTAIAPPGSRLQRRLCYAAAVGVLCLTVSAFGLERFPPPDFVETGHVPPEPTTPPPRADLQEYLDVAALAIALALASYLVLKRRSRWPVFALMIAALLYFGFYRKGCVCAIGATQNVAYGLAGGSFVPVTVLAFFLLPLALTLFFGRTFCAAVCPLGAVQDAVLLRPVKVPRWLEHGLGLLPYVYLGAAVLFAATGSAFIICQYDPFVAIFRLSGGLTTLILGASVVLIALFVGRPYCRYLCPYGAILRHLSRGSKWHATITPDECIRCRLCEDACPFGAIELPTPEGYSPPRSAGKTHLALVLLLTPLLAFAGGLLTSRASRTLARMHATVRLAERMELEEAGLVKGTTKASDAYRGLGQPIEQLYREADALRGRFRWGSWALGGFLGLVVGAKLVQLAVRRHRSDYLPDRAKCVSCGRCFKYCPIELDRRKKLKGRRSAT